MILIEKEQHPRHKQCEGGLTYFVLRVLRNLRFSATLRVPHVAINDVHFRYQHRVFSVCGSPLVLVYHRSVLDEYLEKQARQRGGGDWSGFRVCRRGDLIYPASFGAGRFQFRGITPVSSHFISWTYIIEVHGPHISLSVLPQP